jgi:hypothetical protein
MHVGSPNQVLDAVARDLGMLPIDAEEVRTRSRDNLDADRVRDGRERADEPRPFETSFAEAAHLAPLVIHAAPPPAEPSSLQLRGVNSRYFILEIFTGARSLPAGEEFPS